MIRLPAARHRALKDGAIQYGFSLASGLASFLALKLMQHTVPNPALYSQLSTVLLSFTTFQLITDFGTQTEFIRSFRTSQESARQNLLIILFQSRVFLGLLAILVACVYAFSAGYRQDMAIAFILFHLSFLPFSVMSTSDSIFLAEKKFSKAIWARIGRLFAIAAFVVPTVVLTNVSLMAPILCFTAAIFVTAGLIWTLVLSKKLNHGFVKLFQSQMNEDSVREVRNSYTRGSLIAASIIALQLTQTLIAQAFLTRQVGETALTSFNTALAIATPAILAFQTISQLQLPSVAEWTNDNNASVNESLFRYALKIIAIFAVMICGLWMTDQFGWIQWFFPFSNANVIKLSSMVILAHAILNLANPTIALCQFRNKARPFLLATALALPLSWASQYVMSFVWPEAALLTGLIFFGVALTVSSYLISGLFKKHPIS